MMKRTKANKKSRKFLNISKKSKKKIYIILGLVVAIILAFYLLIRAYALYLKNLYLTEPISILFMGMDGGNSDFADRDALYADSMMGLSYNPDANHLEMLSIPRDIYTQISCKPEGQSRGEKINSAFMYGTLINDDGVGCMKDTIAYSTGMEFNRYARVDFESVINVADLVGPISITAINGNRGSEFCEQDQFGNPDAFCWTEGRTYQMKGEELLAYVRHRKTDTTVFRERRSQQVMEQMIIRMVSLEITGQRKVVKEAFEMIDTNMQYEEVRALALNFVTFPSTNAAQLQTTGISNLNMPSSQLLLSDGTNELLVAAYMLNFRPGEFHFSFSDVVFFTNADRFNPNVGYLRTDEPKEEPIDPPVDDEDTNELSLNLSGQTLLNVTESTQLIALLSDGNASVSSIQYTSSNPAVASINSAGLVTGISAGTATMTATITTTDGRVVTGSLTLTVLAPPTEVPIIPEEPDIPVSEPTESDQTIQ